MTANAINDLSDSLIVYGIEIGFAERRLALARMLHDDGLSALDLELLGDHCKATTASESGAANVLRKLLGEPKLRDDRLADLRKRADMQKAKEGGAANGDSRKPIGPIEGEDPERWERERRCRMAASLIRSDKWAVERVARELGVTVKEAAEMAKLGLEMLSSPMVRGISPREAEKARKQETQRSNDFRQRMRDDKARSAAGRKPVGIDWKRLTWHKADLLEIVRQNGKIDLATVRGDKARMGALAELEYAGEILRDGPPDADSVQPYRIATSDEQRREFREQLRAWCHADMDRKNHRAAGVEVAQS
jgi:AraC-like DNA-binding protein